MARTRTASRRAGLTIADTLSILRRRLVEAIEEWRGRVSSRRDLLRLSDLDLWDLHLTRADAEQEASKPFWQE